MAQVRAEYGKTTVTQVLTGLETAPKRIDIFKYLMICMILFTVVSVFHVWSRVRLVNLNLEISDIHRKLKETAHEHKALKLEAASLKAPARIEAIAKEQLGLSMPTEQQVIHVK